MIVIDDFVNQDHANYIHDRMIEDIPWWFNPSKSGSEDELYNYQFIHRFFSFQNGGYSSAYDLVEPLVSAINFKTYRITALSRIKGNFQPVMQERYKSQFHWDYHFKDEPDENMMVAIYYVNTNDGYTEFEDGTIIKSIANRLILFSNSIKHRGVSQLDTKHRIVLNFNFYGLPL
jgi:hypothetical protein